MNCYHFIGVGGISMSALALELKRAGYSVQGSDLKPTEITRKLESAGIKVFYGHRASNVNENCTVIVTNAISEDNPELIEAKLLNLKILTRGELLGEVSKHFKNVIAISGAHGKTTTTEMLAEIFIAANKNPTVHIGGESKSFNSNLRLGGKKYFICEACEYKNSFLNLKANVGVILNMEPEHLDFFKNYKNVVRSFEKFQKNCKKCVKIDKKHFIAYTNNFYVQAKNVTHLKKGKYGYDLYAKNAYLGKIYLNAIGKHNVLNSLAAICVALLYKIDYSTICHALFNYKGVKRRYEIISEHPNLIVCDYAHHPTEIKKIILSTRKFCKNKIIVAFQPHTYSRTKTLFKEFISALSLADEIHIIKTYSAREKYDASGSAERLASSLNANYYGGMKSAYNAISKRLKSDNTLLILGAGNIDELAEMFRGK